MSKPPIQSHCDICNEPIECIREFNVEILSRKKYEELCIECFNDEFNSCIICEDYYHEDLLVDVYADFDDVVCNCYLCNGSQFTKRILNAQKKVITIRTS